MKKRDNFSECYFQFSVQQKYKLQELKKMSEEKVYKVKSFKWAVSNPVPSLRWFSAVSLGLKTLEDGVTETQSCEQAFTMYY